jgi:hypothetical protein
MEANMKIMKLSLLIGFIVLSLTFVAKAQEVSLYKLTPAAECGLTKGDSSIDSVLYPKSLSMTTGVCNNCDTVYVLGKKYEAFKAVLGTSDEYVDSGCKMSILINNEEVYESKYIQNAEEPEILNIDVNDATKIVFRIKAMCHNYSCTLGTPVLIPKNASGSGQGSNTGGESSDNSGGQTKCSDQSDQIEKLKNEIENLKATINKLKADIANLKKKKKK